MWGRGGVVVSALDFRSDGWWFDAQSLPSWGYGRELRWIKEWLLMQEISLFSKFL